MECQASSWYIFFFFFFATVVEKEKQVLTQYAILIFTLRAQKE